MPAETADPIVAAALADLDAGGDPVRTVAQLTASPDSGAALRRFGEMAKLLYAPRRNLAAMLAVGRAGVAYGLAEAARPGPEDAAAALKLGAMRLGYNVAANCWPGWGDEGVNPTADQVGEALALAEESQALRAALVAGPDARGHWLVGALMMAVGRNAEAAAAFEQAEAASDAAGKDAGVLMARGYRALVDRRDPVRRERGEAALAEALAALARSGADDAQFFIDQLQTAERILG